MCLCLTPYMRGAVLEVCSRMGMFSDPLMAKTLAIRIRSWAGWLWGGLLLIPSPQTCRSIITMMRRTVRRCLRPGSTSSRRVQRRSRGVTSPSFTTCLRDSAQILVARIQSSAPCQTRRSPVLLMLMQSRETIRIWAPARISQRWKTKRSRWRWPGISMPSPQSWLPATEA